MYDSVDATTVFSILKLSIATKGIMYSAKNHFTS